MYQRLIGNTLKYIMLKLLLLLMASFQRLLHIKTQFYRIISPYDVLVVALLDPRHPGPYIRLIGLYSKPYSKPYRAL